MNRKRVSKSLATRRRRNRLRKLKIAALSLGLATAWGNQGDAATLFTSNGSTTITISDAYTFFGFNSTITITEPPKKAKSIGASVGPVTPPASGGGGGGGNIFLTSLSEPEVDEPSDFVPLNGERVGSFFAGVDAGGDLVLSVPNGGDGVVGQSWMSLFIPSPNEDQARRVTEGQVVQALSTPPVLSDSRAPTDSPLDILDRYYFDLLVTPYGEESTLVAFRGAANTGEIVGTYRTTIVPEPATWAFVASAAAGVVCGVRRRE